jgi:Tfp pilus assembly protein PilN
LVTRIELGKEQRRLTEAAGLSRAAFDAQQALSEAQHEMDALESRVRKVAGIGPAWGPTLVMLATLAPESVQLTTVELGGDAAKPGVSLKGFAAAPDATEATRAVKAYMDALEGLPLISGVRLEGTERGKFDGRSEQRFEIRAELVRAAGRPATASAEAKEEER